MYDSAHYHEGALGIVYSGSFVGFDGYPLFHRLPGYSTFMATVYSLTNESVFGVLFFQILLSSFIPILIYRIVKQLTNNEALSCLSGMLSIIAPAYMIFAGFIMSECLFTLLFLLFLTFFLKSLGAPDRKSSILVAGIFFGLASLVRPVGHLLISILLIFILFFFEGDLRRRVKKLVIFFISWLAIVVPWLVRNFLLTGHIFFHTLPGQHFMNHLAVRIFADVDSISYVEAKRRLYTRLYCEEIDLMNSLGRKLMDIERCKLSERIAFGAVKNYPLVFLKIAALNCCKTICALYSSELLVIDACGELPSYDRKMSWKTLDRFLRPDVHNKKIVAIVYIELLFLIFTILGFCLAVWRFWRNFFNSETVLALALIGFFIVISFGCGYARLRLPIEIFYILAASYGIHEITLWCKAYWPSR